MMVDPRDDFRREFSLFNQRLDQLLKEEGTSHGGFAAMIGLHASEVTSRFTYRTAWKVRDVKRCAMLLDVSVDYLLGLSDVPSRLDENVRPKTDGDQPKISSFGFLDGFGGDDGQAA
ncbi:hypothetical protein [Bifidobacterium aerophilum]|uniref:XRE family transcriptional regulator n=1 Tax=Bifidobacterium aerophilum TaxID=1798155 RepID=A0A6N9Z6R3_9BIFI|nr:hypothetical protein [Bifidobacterium aerophilum]NEG89815.1 hypothetical protein [Bifidobacterium aerophilum]